MGILYSIVRVLLQDDESLHDGRDGQVLLRGELGPLAACEQHGRSVRLVGDSIVLSLRNMIFVLVLFWPICQYSSNLVKLDVIRTEFTIQMRQS